MAPFSHYEDDWQAEFLSLIQEWQRQQQQQQHERAADDAASASATPETEYTRQFRAGWIERRLHSLGLDAETTPGTLPAPSPSPSPSSSPSSPLFPNANHALLERAQERAFAAVFGERPQQHKPIPEAGRAGADDIVAPTLEHLLMCYGTETAGALLTLRRCVQEFGVARYQEDTSWYTTLERLRLDFLAALERQGRLG